MKGIVALATAAGAAATTVPRGTRRAHAGPGPVGLLELADLRTCA